MFKIGFFSHGPVGPDPTPNPVNFDGLMADNTLAVSSGTYQYIAQQITGINIPITLQLKSTLDPTYGHVYFRVTNSWPYGTFQSNDGPLSGTYGTFTQAPGAVIGSPFNLLTPISFTVTNNQWLIMAVDGTTAIASPYSFAGILFNVDDGTYLSGLSGGSYNLQTNIANPMNIGTGPTYDYTNNPSEWFYSSSGIISGIIPTATTIDLEITYTDDITFNSLAVLYYKVSTSAPPEKESWSTSDPVTLGYSALAASGSKIFGVKDGNFITFAIGTGGKTVQGFLNTTITVYNNSHLSDTLSSFNGEVNTP
jgi:hypothetical protein